MQGLVWGELAREYDFEATTKKYLNPTLVLKSESVGRRDLAGARRSGVTTPTIIGRVDAHSSHGVVSGCRVTQTQLRLLIFQIPGVVLSIVAVMSADFCANLRMRKSQNHGAGAWATTPIDLYSRVS